MKAHRNRKTTLPLLFAYPAKISLLLFFAVFAIGCNDSPEDILPENKLVQIIVDMSVLEGSMSVVGISRTEYQKREAYYNSVFEKYNISSKQFDKSITYYTKDIKKIENIYQQVFDILKKRDEEQAKTISEQAATQPTQQ